MATLVTKTVKTAGGDYTSLSGWEAGQQANIVTADQIQRAECYAMSDTTALVVDGWTTDATRYIEIVVATGERHDGKWNTSKYRYETTSTVGMDLVEDYIRLDGLQISQTTTNNNFRGVLFRNGGEYWCQNCIIKGIYTSTAAGRFVTNGATGTLKIWNTIIYDGVAGTNGIEGLQNQSTGTLYASNVTLQNCRTGFRRNAGTFVAKNCIAQDCNDGWSGTFDAASTNNCSDIASDAPTTNAQTGTVAFVDKANDDFHLDASDTVAKDHGTDLSADANIAFSTDIDAATRSGTWDIGADEITSGATTHTADRTESGTAADSQTAVCTFVSSLTESVTSTDSQTGVTTTAGARTESLTAAESSDAIVSQDVSSSESVTASDSSTAIVAFAASASESLSASDSETVAATFVSSLTESGSATDSQDATATFTAATSESVTASESQESPSGSTYTDSRTETLTAADSVSATVRKALGPIGIEINAVSEFMEGELEGLRTEIHDALVELEPM